MGSMQRLIVDPHAVAEASARLGTVASGVDDVHGKLARHFGAGGGTPAAGAVDDLLTHFSQVLPRFALASAHLSRAVGEAAHSYHATDSAIAEACEAGTQTAQGVPA
jgi:hypothetical protein